MHRLETPLEERTWKAARTGQQDILDTFSFYVHEKNRENHRLEQHHVGCPQQDFGVQDRGHDYRGDRANTDYRTSSERSLLLKRLV